MNDEQIEIACKEFCKLLQDDLEAKLEPILEWRKHERKDPVWQDYKQHILFTYYSMRAVAKGLDHK